MGESLRILALAQLILSAERGLAGLARDGGVSEG